VSNGKIEVSVGQMANLRFVLVTLAGTIKTKFIIVQLLLRFPLQLLLCILVIETYISHRLTFSTKRVGARQLACQDMYISEKIAAAQYRLKWRKLCETLNSKIKVIIIRMPCSYVPNHK
jgi:hypothetical protein